MERVRRRAVLMSALVTTALKLTVAASTFGTNDVHYWTDFARGVRRYGPVGIYGHHFPARYNHGPLMGWLLAAINHLHDAHVGSYPFLIRAPACLADLVTVLLVYELVRLHRSNTHAAIAATLVAWSPVLFVISGFHGNTDPLFVMFVLLSVYLLVGRDWTYAAGLAFAAAVSIKLVPIVVAPTLLVVLVRRGRRQLAAFCAGSATVFLLVWLPVLISRWSAFRHQVLGYNGIPDRHWGLVELLTWAHLPGAVAWLAGTGRFGIVLVSGLAAAVVVYRRRDAAPAAAALSLVLFLLSSSAFSMQYLAWAAAGAYLIGTRAATAYGVTAGAFLVVVYDDWNGAPPWHWHEAHAVPLTPSEVPLMLITWLALAAVALTGLRLAVRGERP